MDKRTKEYKKRLKENPEGLGDTVDRVLNDTPLKHITKVVKKVLFKNGEDCGCDGRKKKLNEIFPYNTKTGRCFTEKEYSEYKDLKRVLSLTIKDPQVKFICKLYSEIFKKPYYEPCRNCSPKPILKMIEKLDKVLETYEN